MLGDAGDEVAGAMAYLSAHLNHGIKPEVYLVYRNLGPLTKCSEFLYKEYAHGTVHSKFGLPLKPLPKCLGHRGDQRTLR